MSGAGYPPPPSRVELRISDTAKHSLRVRDMALRSAKLRIRELMSAYKRIVVHAEDDVILEYAADLRLPAQTELELRELRPRSLTGEKLRVLEEMRNAHRNSVYLVDAYGSLPLCGQLYPLVPALSQTPKPTPDLSTIDGDFDTASPLDIIKADIRRLRQILDDMQGAAKSPTLPSAEPISVVELGFPEDSHLSGAPPGPSPLSNIHNQDYDGSEEGTQDMMDLDEKPQEEWIENVPELSDDSSDWEDDKDGSDDIYIDPEFHPFTVSSVDDKFEMLKRDLKRLDWVQEVWDLHRLAAELHDEPFDVERPEMVVTLPVLLTLRAWIGKYHQFQVYMELSFCDMRNAVKRRKGRSAMAAFGGDIAHVILSRGEGSPLSQSSSADDPDSLVEEESWGGARSRPARKRLLGSPGTPISRPD